MLTPQLSYQLSRSSLRTLCVHCGKPVSSLKVPAMPPIATLWHVPSGDGNDSAHSPMLNGSPNFLPQSLIRLIQLDSHSLLVGKLKSGSTTHSVVVTNCCMFCVNFGGACISWRSLLMASRHLKHYSSILGQSERLRQNDSAGMANSPMLNLYKRPSLQQKNSRAPSWHAISMSCPKANKTNSSPW